MKRPIATAGVILALSVPALAQEEVAPLDRLMVKVACSEILYTYGEGLDDVDPAKVAGVFAQDGVWTADGEVEVEGRVALRELWVGIAANERPSVGRHAINNIRWNVLDERNASGTALVQQHRYNPGKPEEIETLATMMLVEIDMHCTLTNEGWRFARMNLSSVSISGYRHGEE